MGLLRVANELDRRNGLLRQRPVLRESVLVGRLLPGISTWVSSAVLPAAATTDATSGGLAATATWKQATVSSAERRTTGNLSATRWRETAGTTDGGKTATSTERGQTARRRQTACDHSTGAANAAITAWKARRTAFDSAGSYA